MISEKLKKIREYEEKAAAQIPEADRPFFHFSPRVGWLNDPNGFSFYGGKYHLFYQYHPYSSYWGPMHWGHAVSSDMISWEYLPAAMAPDTEYDKSGCFSGTAITLPDGRQLLMYTGCGDSSEDPLDKGRWLQTQCVAVSKETDKGIEFEKFGSNPVIKAGDFPEDCDPYEFRDPYLWRAADGTYRALVAAGRTGEIGKDGNYLHEKGTQLILFRSDDCFEWEFGKVMFEDHRRIGVMWECPNFFLLGGKYVLIASPMDMQAEEEEAVGSIRFPKGNNVCYILGDYTEGEFIPDADENGRFIYAPVDGGLDFYAPQVMETPDGRRVMIGWMQDPKSANHHEDSMRIFGQMTVPRELSLKDGILYQWPVAELEAYRKEKVHVSRTALSDMWTQLPEITGRSVDILAEITEANRAVGIRLAADAGHFIQIVFDPVKSTITIDRSASGLSEEMTAKRTIKVRNRGGALSLRILIDRWSAEIFINDGEQAVSLTFYTDIKAQDIAFKAEGNALIELTKYTISG